jgi:hypothetical protein
MTCLLTPFADDVGAEATLASSQRKIFLIKTALKYGVSNQNINVKINVILILKIFKGGHWHLRLLLQIGNESV